MSCYQIFFLWIVCSDLCMFKISKMKKGMSTFKNDSLKHIELHHAVFKGCTVVGNHSDVDGAASTVRRCSSVANSRCCSAHSRLQASMPSPITPQTTTRDKGDRAVTGSASSEGSSKKS